MKKETPEGTIAHRWYTLDNKRMSILSRSEQYARWTIPSVFPAMGAAQSTELQGTNNNIGARGTNHLANRVVTTLFRPQGAFFRLHMDTTIKKKLEAAIAKSGVTDKVAVAQAFEAVEQELTSTEMQAMDNLDMVGFRPNATNTAKLLIVTGNALEYHPEGRAAQVYTMRDYVVVRDLSGVVIEIITREQKAFETFKPEVQAMLQSQQTHEKNEGDSADNVTVYTKICLEEDGKWHATQEANLVSLDTGLAAVWPNDDTLPWIPLTWNLIRGEDYGRGLIEEYAGVFNALEVYHQSLINIAGIMGDIKFLVNPRSLIDINRLNTSKPGSYHTGADGDITVIEMHKQHDAQFISMMIDNLEKQLAQVFLLNSSVTRDAERVTAEEIRMQANELETSNGGIYSRLASQWQVPLANIVLVRIKFEGNKYGIKPSIITGMDSLSRTGEMDNLRMLVQDLSMLNAVPEDVRRAINPTKFAAYCATARQVDYNKFLYTEQELQQQQQQAMQQQQQMAMGQAQADAHGATLAEAGKQAVQG